MMRLRRPIPRSPLWTPAIILLMFGLWGALPTLVEPFRGGWYHLPAERVVDPEWIEPIEGRRPPLDGVVYVYGAWGMRRYQSLKMRHSFHEDMKFGNLSFPSTAQAPLSFHDPWDESVEADTGITPIAWLLLDKADRESPARLLGAWGSNWRPLDDSHIGRQFPALDLQACGRSIGADQVGLVLVFSQAGPPGSEMHLRCSEGGRLIADSASFSFFKDAAGERCSWVLWKYPRAWSGPMNAVFRLKQEPSEIFETTDPGGRTREGGIGGVTAKWADDIELKSLSWYREEHAEKVAILLLTQTPRDFLKVDVRLEDGSLIRPELHDTQAARTVLCFFVPRSRIASLRFGYGFDEVHTAFRVPSLPPGAPAPRNLLDLPFNRFETLPADNSVRLSASAVPEPGANFAGLPAKRAIASWIRDNPGMEVTLFGKVVRLERAGTTRSSRDYWFGQLVNRLEDPWFRLCVLPVGLAPWVIWVALRAITLRKGLRFRGHGGLGWLQLLGLYLEFGRHASRLPDAQEAAALPGVDVTSWRSLRRLLKTRLDGT